MGTLDGPRRSLRLFHEEGPNYGVHVNARKTRIYWPNTPPQERSALLTEIPLTKCSRDGFELRGAAIGNRVFTESFLRAKVDGCRRTLQLLHHFRDPRARFHMHRICASACLLNRAFRLASPLYAVSAADDFDALQRACYIELHGIALFGLRYRGERSFLIRQALNPLREFLLFVSAHPYSVDLGPLDPALLAAEPRNLQNYLQGVQQEARAKDHWPDDLWPAYPTRLPTLPQRYGAGYAASLTGTAPQQPFSSLTRLPLPRCPRHAGRPCFADISDSPSMTTPYP